MGWVHTGYEPATAHEGYAAAVLSDGTETATHSAWTTGLDGEHVVGWRGGCECGWTSTHTYDRATYPSNRSVEPAEVEAQILAEWEAHVHEAVPELALHEAIRSEHSAAAQVEVAVRAARGGGATWATIGAVAGLSSRQGAYERWGHLEQAQELQAPHTDTDTDMGHRVVASLLQVAPHGRPVPVSAPWARALQTLARHRDRIIAAQGALTALEQAHTHHITGRIGAGAGAAVESSRDVMSEHQRQLNATLRQAEQDYAELAAHLLCACAHSTQPTTTPPHLDDEDLPPLPEQVRDMSGGDMDTIRDAYMQLRDVRDAREQLADYGDGDIAEHEIPNFEALQDTVGAARAEWLRYGDAVARALAGPLRPHLPAPAN